MKKSAIAVAVSALMCALLAGLRPTPAAPVTVRTMTAAAGTSVVSVDASGVLEPYRTRTLGVAGWAVADEIYLNVGAPVAAGQVIMTFAPAEAPAVDLSIESAVASADLSDLLDGGISSALSGSMADALSAAELVSPFDGVLTALNIAEGEQTSPFAVLAEVSDMSRIRARVRLSEDDLRSVSVGMPAAVETASAAYEAVVIEVSPVVRTASSITGGSERYGEAVLELYEPSDLTVGSSVTARILTERRTDVMTLPFDAVDQDAANREFVYVLDDGRARLCFVQTGRELGDAVEVTGGILPGDEVIIHADGELYNGCEVTK